MIALATTNVVGAVLFASLYATAGARLMPQAAFVTCLLVIFVLVTTLWLQAEARHRGLGILRRIGRGAAALVIAVLGIPGIVLAPAFWLDMQLPPDAGFSRVLAPLMSVILISLLLIVVVNVVGALVAAGRAVFRRSARVQ